ncbi:MAG: hypothetical protein ABIB47_03170 [Candidatus Woesearchaeota archaeon]
MGKEGINQLKDMKESVVIAVVPAKKYEEINLKLIKYLTQEIKIPGAYVTLNKPFIQIKDSFKKAKIDVKLIIFIDAITETSGGKTKKTKDCLFIGTPENLSDISLAMDQAVTALPGKEKFLFFDSLTTLLMYNDTRTVARFIHFLSGKMRAWKVRGIIVSLQKKGNEDLINELSQFCDMRLDL